MAETAQDPIKASDVPASEVMDATDPTSTTAEREAVADLQNTDGPASGLTAPDPINASDVPDATSTTAIGETGADDSSTSPENKRKDPPVSVSAHERTDRNNKRQRGGHHHNKSSRIRTRFEDQPESSDPDEIRRQVEFYFSDSNLPIDAYLLNETGGHKNRPVPLKVIHNFKRMRHFQPFAAVRDAVRESKFLELDEHDEIRRRVPLSDKFTDDPQRNRGLVHSSSMARSIYAKGFGEETRTTHLDIEAFFAPYGPVNAVRLRRHDDGEFKGSVFVEFADEDTMKQFLELEPKPTWGDDEKELEIMSKQDYVDMKHQGILDGTVKPKSAEGNYRGGRGGRGGQRGNDRRGSKEHHDKDDWKSRRDRDQERDRRGGRGRGRGRGNDRGGRRGGRRSSPDYNHHRRDRRDDDEERAKDRAELPEGDAGAGAREADVAANGEAKAEAQANGQARATENGGEAAPPAAGAKKRAREDGEEAGAGDAKRTKDETAAA